jgi:hypothetical protein
MFWNMWWSKRSPAPFDIQVQNLVEDFHGLEVGIVGPEYNTQREFIDPEESMLGKAPTVE